MRNSKTADPQIVESTATTTETETMTTTKIEPEDLSHMTAAAEKCLADMERKLRAQPPHPIFGSWDGMNLTHCYTFGEIQDKVAAAITRAAANEAQVDNAYRVATTFAQDFPTKL